MTDKEVRAQIDEASACAAEWRRAAQAAEEAVRLLRTGGKIGGRWWNEVDLADWAAADAQKRWAKVMEVWVEKIKELEAQCKKG